MTIRLFVLLLILLLITPLHAAAIKHRVYLNVPLVQQGKLLCGPATIEMLFRYWGVDQYDQYDIAYAMLMQFSASPRYRKSGIYTTDPVDWDKYPGTTTASMYDFLQRFASTHQFMLEYEAESLNERLRKRSAAFSILKSYVSNGIPVIVHQYSALQQPGMHYRIVTGYDEALKAIYLNDADGGKRIIQSYEQFFRLWNVDEKWLHYNAIAFNVDRRRLQVRL